MEKYTQKGCGDCPNNKNPCKTCNSKLCNTENFLKSHHFCYHKDHIWNECKDKVCYYAQIDVPNNFYYKYVCGEVSRHRDKEIYERAQFVSCYQNFCNLQKLYNETLSCLQLEKKPNELAKKMKCNKQCGVERTLNGDLIQGCFDCKTNVPSTQCKTCKTNNCNEEKLVHKQCFNNEGICETSFNASCYMTRNLNNKIEKGCGKCKTKACKECQDNRCNDWDIKFYCKSSNGNNGINQCDTSDCYIMKLNNKDKYHYNCGKCPISTSDFIKIPKEFDINKVLCAECNNSPFCNTEKFLKNQKFCLIKSPNNSLTTKGTRVCKDECFVYRNITTGNVTQGCGKCPSKIDKNECTTCKENYCNEEQLVHKHCWINETTICKTEFNSPCYTWRAPTNNVSRGCGYCPFINCKECKEHRCNDNEPPFYCIGFNGNFKECKENDCYIAKIEINDGDNKIEQFHYDCGKCPLNVLNILSNKINMSNVQCVDCNNKPTCNSDPFFKSQLFCWEKNVNEWNPNKGKRICEKGKCFIGVDKKEIVQGCGKCSEFNNLIKCNDCSSSLCNDETKLPPPRMCYHLNAHFQPFKVKNKTCHHLIDNCYIAMDIFMRAEQNCGDCPLKYKHCKTCNETNFCNNSTLIHLQTKTTIKTNNYTTATNIITTTTTKTFKTTIKKSLTTTKHYFNKTSSANFNKFNIKIIIILIVLAMMFFKVFL